MYTLIEFYNLAWRTIGYYALAALYVCAVPVVPILILGALV